MQLVYAEYDDFASFQGSLSDFIHSDIYQHRLHILDNVGRERVPDSPKRKAPEELPTAEYKTEKKPKEAQRDEKSPLNKIKKKAKKTEKKETPSKQPEKPIQQTPLPIQTIPPAHFQPASPAPLQKSTSTPEMKK